MTAVLVREEGERLAAYRDSEGYWTIGVGRLIDSRKGGGITRGESRMLLTHDIERAQSAARRYDWYDALDEDRQGVVVAMIFQLGAEGFSRFRRMIQAMAVLDYNAAAAEMLDSRWARQTPDRAERMALAMRTGRLIPDPPAAG